MSLAIDFTSIPRLAGGDYRLPGGGFLPTTPLRAKADVHEAGRDGDFVLSYRVLDGLGALSEVFRHPLAGLFAPGLAP